MKKEFNRQFDRIFVTGDIHGDMHDLENRVLNLTNSTKDDLLILLGDCAFFYNEFYSDWYKDLERRRRAADLPITILCIQGNHEVPYSQMKAERINLLEGEGYHADDIYFAMNGTTLNLNGKSALVVGGGYSVDKEIRLSRNYPYWEKEELSDAELDVIIEAKKGKKYDFIFSHTCAYSDMPVHVFLPGVDQRKVSKRTELALERIKYGTQYGKWFCGHFHAEFQRGDVRFLYRDVEQII